jgi:plastocyanin
VSWYDIAAVLRRPPLILLAGALLLPAGPALAQADERVDPDELRREVKLLRVQVQALRSALAETAELDRQRSAVLTKALKLGGGPEVAAGARSEREAEAPGRRNAVSGRGDAQEGALQPAVRRAPEPPPVSVIRGKVDVPPNEPVAYVYVENILEPAVKGQKVVIKQEGKTFIPAWAVVQRGTTIEFPNLDNIYHNVFSLSSGNTFDLGLYNSANDSRGHTFTEPGAVDIYCNIHPQMAASTLVLPNRHYAKVKRDGTFEIPRVPDGRRKIVAWAPGSRLNAQWVELRGGSANVSLKLEPKGVGHKNKAGRSYGSYE